jgi:hypothetical protein
MKRLAAISLVCLAAWLPRPAHALPVGGPGFALAQEDKTFAVTGGVGYSYRLVEGDAYKGQNKIDTQTSLKLLVRAEAAVLPWFTPMLTVGMADRTRYLGKFDGTLGPLVGAGVRFDPVIPERDGGVGFAVLAQGSWEQSSGTGNSLDVDPDPDVESFVDQTQRADTWHVELAPIIAFKQARVGLYAGPKLDYERTVYTKRSEDVTPRLPVGVVIGVDYDITPEVFFTAEMENFHQDAIYGLVGGRF